MRTETITKTYLNFDELTPEQQKKVLDNYRDINVNHNWYEFTYQEYVNKLKKLGFHSINIEFSGFWSQGDGASFSAKHKRGDIYKVGRYSHDNTMRCDENQTLLLVARRIAKKLYRDLEKEYEYLTSNECIKDSLIANEYEFDKDTLRIA